MEPTQVSEGHFLSLGAKLGHRYWFKKNLYQLAASIGVGLELKTHRGLRHSRYSGKFTGTETAIQAFNAAIAIWRGTW